MGLLGLLVNLDHLVHAAMVVLIMVVVVVTQKDLATTEIKHLRAKLTWVRF